MCVCVCLCVRACVCVHACVDDVSPTSVNIMALSYVM